MDKKEILLVGFGPLEEKLALLLKPMDYAIRRVQPSQMNQTIGQLCLEEEALPTEPAMERGVVLFRNFSQEDLDPALRVLRQAELPRQPHKAMVTATNWHWKLGNLIKELDQEQIVMTALIRLKQLRDRMPMPAFTDIPAMKARMRAEVLLKGGEEATVEAIEQAYQELLKFAPGAEK